MTSSSENEVMEFESGLHVDVDALKLKDKGFKAVIVYDDIPIKGADYEVFFGPNSLTIKCESKCLTKEISYDIDKASNEIEKQLLFQLEPVIKLFKNP